MNIYQLYYTRKGKQEFDAGWQIVGKSDEIMPDMAAYYKGMRSQETDGVGKCMETPDSAITLERNGYYLYLTASNYNAEGLDNRGNIFYHGLVFYISDFYEICKLPENICGLGNNTFVSDNKGGKNIEILSCLHELKPEYCFNFQQIIEKYQFTEKKYRKLMKAIYWKMFHPEESFCICVGSPIELYEQCCRELMYIIYLGLPYQLRGKLTFSSFFPAQGKIFFSREITNENYFEVETGKCDYPKKEKGEFDYQEKLIQYAWEEKYREQVYQRIEEICVEAWGEYFDEIGNFQMQVICDAILREIDEDLLSQRLDQVLGLQTRVCQELNTYIAWLISRMYEVGISFTEVQIDKLLRLIQTSDCSELKEKYCYIFAVQFCDELSEENYQKLFEVKFDNEEQYWKIIDILQSGRMKFLKGYFKDFICRYKILSLNDMEICTDKFPIAYTELEFYPVWETMLFLLYEKEVKEISKNSERYVLYEQYISYVEKCLQEEKDKRLEIKEKLWEEFWNAFQMIDYRYDCLQEYRDWGLEKAGCQISKAEHICQISKAEEKLIEEFDGNLFNQFLYKLNQESDQELDSVLRDLQEIYITRNKGYENPVALLWLSHSPLTGKMNLDSWFKWIDKKNNEFQVFSAYKNDWKAFRKSPLSCDSFLTRLERHIKKCRKNRKKDLSQELDNLYNYLKFGTVKMEDSTEEGIFLLYQKALLIMSTLLIEEVVIKSIYSEIKFSSFFIAVIPVIISVILLILTVILFRTDNGICLVEFSEKSIMQFCMVMASICIISFILCMGLWLSKSAIWLFIVMAVSLLISGLRFIYYF